MKYSTSDASDVVDIRVGLDGEGSNAEPTTVMKVFQDTVAKFGDRDALHVKRSRIEDGQVVYDDAWTKWTFKEYYNDVIRFAKALTHYGFQQHKCINIIGFNSPEWVIANMGAIAAGGIAAGIYTTNNAEACHYVAEHSEAEVVVVEDVKQLNKFISIQKDLPKLKALVMWTGEVPEGTQCGVPIHTFSQFLALGAEISDNDINARIDATLPGHCATLIYTSGTTGPPKAVMISHDNLTWTSKRFMDDLPVRLTHEERSISYLPLSHVAAQMLDIHCPITVGSRCYFARPDALKGSLKGTLSEVRPTYFFGVPRVWEKFYETMMALGRSTTGIKKSIGSWAKGKGAEKTRLNQFGNGGGAPSGFGCANALILKKVKNALGLNECKLCFVGAAPISTDILQYFGSLDIPIYELFGQSECTGPHTTNFAGQWKIGSIGKTMSGTSTKVVESNKEYCYKGRHVFMGYMKMPDKTAETIDAEGWLHSGDVATADNDGFWSITGRIKELIITAGGENVAPVLIEDEIKRELPAIGNVMVIGDKRKYLTCVIGLRTEVDENGRPMEKLTGDSERLGKEFGSKATTWKEASTDEVWLKHIEEGITRANAKAISNAQKVQKFKIVEDFSEKGGELTPTLKLKRSVAAEKHSALIEEMYK